MIRVFKSNQPLVAIFFPLFALIIALVYYFSGQEMSPVNLGLWGEKHVIGKAWLVTIIAIVLAYNAYSINKIFNGNDFLERNTYVVGLIYIIGCITIPVFENPGIILFHFFDILSFRQLFFVKQNEDARKYIFNGSFLLAIGITFFPHAFPVLLFPFFTLMVIRPFVWREYALIFLGFGTTFVYAVFYYYFFGTRAELLGFFWQSDLGINWSVVNLIQFLTWALLLLISFFIINSKIRRSGLRFKRLITLAWISVFLLIVSEFVHFFNQKDYLMISQVGTTILVATGISLTRISILFNLALYFLILFGIYIQIGITIF